MATEPTEPTEPAEPVEPPTPTDPPAPDPEPESFDADYVRGLRTEAAEHRTARRAAEERATALAVRLDTRTLADTLGPVLADPDDLARFADLDTMRDDDGLLDPTLVETAARELVKARPHLSKTPRGRGPSGGPRPPAAGDDGPAGPGLFAQRLREAAGNG